MNNVTLIENLPELEYEPEQQDYKTERLIYNRQDSPLYKQQQQQQQAAAAARVPSSSFSSVYQPRDVSDQPMMSCLDVAGHIQECPICSKLYSCDKSVYLVIIIILSVACMLLLRRVLEK